MEVEGPKEKVYAQWRKECKRCQEKSQGAVAIKQVVEASKILNEAQEAWNNNSTVSCSYYSHLLERLQSCLMLKKTTES